MKEFLSSLPLILIIIYGLFFRKPKRSVSSLTDAELEQERARIKRDNILTVIFLIALCAYYFLLYKLT